MTLQNQENLYKLLNSVSEGTKSMEQVYPQTVRMPSSLKKGISHPKAVTKRVEKVTATSNAKKAMQNCKKHEK